MESLRDKVVVVTGASSGLGREVAVRFAHEGAFVVLAARRAARLEQTAQACREAGGRALCVVTDVTREEDVHQLAERALAAGGHIDVWVNNAGVTMFAPIEVGPFVEHRRVIETNLFGPMFAARALLPVFRRQGHGVMINVGSILSKIGQPFVPSYAVSKFALHGLSETLRVELADLPDVHVCLVMPYAMNTPHFESGANRIGLRARAMAPAQAPEKVARAIVRLAKYPRRMLHVPRIAVAGLAWHWLMPRATERLLLHTLQKWHFEPASEPCGEGNLFEPTDSERAAVDNVHGERPPRIGAIALAFWVGAELLRWPVRGLVQRLRGARELPPAGAGARA